MRREQRLQAGLEVLLRVFCDSGHAGPCGGRVRRLRPRVGAANRAPNL